MFISSNYENIIPQIALNELHSSIELRAALEFFHSGFVSFYFEFAAV